VHWPREGLVVIDCAHLNGNVDVMKIGIAKTQREDVGADRSIARGSSVTSSDAPSRRPVHPAKLLFTE
jgi:hypothetical protein